MRSGQSTFDTRKGTIEMQCEDVEGHWTMNESRYDGAASASHDLGIVITGELSGTLEFLGAQPVSGSTDIGYFNADELLIKRKVTSTGRILIQGDANDNKYIGPFDRTALLIGKPNSNGDYIAVMDGEIAIAGDLSGTILIDGHASGDITVEGTVTHTAAFNSGKIDVEGQYSGDMLLTDLAGKVHVGVSENGPVVRDLLGTIRVTGAFNGNNSGDQRAIIMVNETQLGSHVIIDGALGAFARIDISDHNGAISLNNECSVTGAWTGAVWTGTAQIRQIDTPNSPIVILPPGHYENVPDAILYGSGKIHPWGFQSTTCPEDLTGDGAVDAADLGILLANFSDTAANCRGDIDGSGDGWTDNADLGALLARLNLSCP